MTAVLLSLVDKLFDSSFRLLRPLPSLAVLSVFAVLTAVLTLLVVRWTSNQKAIRLVKDRMGARVLEVRLFSDQPRVVLRAYFTLLGDTGLYLRHSLRPLIVLAVPLLLLFTQLEAYFGRTPVDPGQDFLIHATFQNADALTNSVLRPPPGLDLTAPPVHIPSERRVDWRLKAERPGTYDVRLALPGDEISKQVVAGRGLTRIVPQRARGGLWQQIINPGELPLLSTGLVDQIEVQYPVRVFRLRTWEIEWFIPYLVLTLAAALLLKRTLRTEI
jgi:hypothetical protein